MHARIPNLLIKRNTWLNLCIDIQSFVNECFGVTTPAPGGTHFKCLEQIQIEGNLKLRKVFTSRSQIPCEDPAQANLISNSGNINELAEVEFLPKGLDFNPSVNSSNQLINYEVVQAHIQSYLSQQIEESIMITGLQIQNKTQSQGLLSKKQKMLNN